MSNKFVTHFFCAYCLLTKLKTYDIIGAPPSGIQARNYSISHAAQKVNRQIAQNFEALNFPKKPLCKTTKMRKTA